MAKMDGEDELKRQMRRRLVGAVALVTAMVVILPMLFESSPKPNDRGIEVRIPDKDTAGAFNSQMVLPESAPEVASAPEATPEPAPSASAAVAAPPLAAAPVAGAPASVVPPAKPAPVHKPAAAKPEPAHKPAAAKPEPAHKPAPAHAEHGKSAPAKAGFAVQVGAFGNAATARELQGKLHKQGWHSYTQMVGDAIRVRVGPYPTREGAEKARHKLEAQGMHPAVVNEP